MKNKNRASFTGLQTPVRLVVPGLILGCVLSACAKAQTVEAPPHLR
ncbi:hypothetical protein [Asaia prunellae]|nr:hypothetical protein [Asaia prunellae]